MKEELTDFLRFCAVERCLAPLTCAAYERDVSACLGYLQGQDIVDLAEVRPTHLRAFSAEDATRRPAPSNQARATAALKSFFREPRGFGGRDTRAQVVERAQDTALVLVVIEPEPAPGAGRREKSVAALPGATGSSICRLEKRSESGRTMTLVTVASATDSAALGQVRSR